MLHLFSIRLRGLLVTVGMAIFSLVAVTPASAEETVAYCDTPAYAVNVYQDDTPESSEMSLKIRVFWREKSLIFADLPATRNHFSDQGVVYTSQSEVSDDYSSSLWTLFVLSGEEQSCFIFRNGAAFDNGDVTHREIN